MLLAAPSLSAKIVTTAQGQANLIASVDVFKKSPNPANASKALADYSYLNASAYAKGVLQRAGVTEAALRAAAAAALAAAVAPAAIAVAKDALVAMKKQDSEMTPAIDAVAQDINKAKTGEDLDKALQKIGEIEEIAEKSKVIDTKIDEVKASGDAKRIADATNIQKIWKGYKTRKDLKEINKQADEALQKMANLKVKQAPSAPPANIPPAPQPMPVATPIGAMPASTPPPAPDIANFVKKQIDELNSLITQANLPVLSKSIVEKELNKFINGNQTFEGVKKEIETQKSEWATKQSQEGAEALKKINNDLIQIKNTSQIKNEQFLADADAIINKSGTNGFDASKAALEKLIADYNAKVDICKSSTQKSINECKKYVNDTKALSTEIKNAYSYFGNPDFAKLELAYNKISGNESHYQTIAKAIDLMNKLECPEGYDNKLQAELEKEIKNAQDSREDLEAKKTKAEADLKTKPTPSAAPANIPPAPSITEYEKAQEKEKNYKSLNDLISQAGLSGDDLVVANKALSGYKFNTLSYELAKQQIDALIKRQKSKASSTKAQTAPYLQPVMPANQDLEYSKNLAALEAFKSSKNLSAQDQSKADKAIQQFKMDKDYQAAYDAIDLLYSPSKPAMPVVQPIGQGIQVTPSVSAPASGGGQQSATAVTKPAASTATQQATAAQAAVAKGYDYSNITAEMAASDIATLNKSRKNATSAQKEQAKELYNAAVKKGLDKDFDARPRLNALNTAYNLGNARLE